MRHISEGTIRHTWRMGVVLGAIAISSALVGCSSGGSYDEPQGDYAGAPAQEEAAADGATGSDAVIDRSIVVTGSLYLTVEDPLAAADAAADLVQDAGGRVDARSERAPLERDGGEAFLTLRIPTNKLDSVVEDLRELGTVDHFSTQSSDVTTVVTDLEAKISTLEDSTERIQSLLGQAKTITDIITLEDELASRQAELEALKAQQRGLLDQVSLSTIDLTLTTEPVVVPDDSPLTFWDGLVSGWHGLVSFISVALVVIGVLLPWAALAGVIVLAIVLPIRLRRARRARKGRPASAAQTAPHAPQAQQPPSAPQQAAPAPQGPQGPQAP